MNLIKMKIFKYSFSKNYSQVHEQNIGLIYSGEILTDIKY